MEDALKHSFIDAVFRQEYEISFTEFVKKINEYGFNKEKLKSIPGIALNINGEIHLTEPQLIDPLDQLPPPARDIFPRNDRPDLFFYWDGFCQLKPAVQMHASRGCPFKCDFCLWNQVMYNLGKYRTFSPKRIVDEMEEMQKLGAKEIYFDDDSFTINKKHVIDVTNEIKRRNLKVK